jgi:hypothetical protein
MRGRLPGLLGGVAVAAMLAIGNAGTAQAVPAYAFAEIQFTNFSLDLSEVNVTGSTVQGTEATNMTGFTPTSVTTTGNVINGVTSPPGYSGPLGANFGASGLFAGTAGGLHWDQQLTTSTGAQAQQLINGALSGPANSYQVSEAHLNTGPSAAGASTNANTVITINIAALAGQTVTLNANAITTLIASFGTPGDIANASSAAKFEIDDGNGTPVFTDQPSSLNHPIQALFPGITQNYTSNPVTIADSYTFLTSGNFAITLFDSTTVNASTVGVPEPLSIGLLGSGLVALGLIRRRKKA